MHKVTVKTVMWNGMCDMSEKRSSKKWKIMRIRRRDVDWSLIRRD